MYAGFYGIGLAKKRRHREENHAHYDKNAHDRPRDANFFLMFWVENHVTILA